MMKFTAVVIGMSVALISGANAEESLPKGGACAGDIQKFCKGVEPGEGRILKCLKEHEADLSTGCKEKRAEVKEEMKGFYEACKSDLDAYCKDVRTGEGRKLGCLKKNEEKISPACKDAMAASREKRKGKKI